MMDGVQNLYCLDVDELRAILNTSDNERVKDYCQYKIIAMRARLSGDVAKAIRCEDRCERIYSALPESLRW